MSWACEVESGRLFPGSPLSRALSMGRGLIFARFGAVCCP